MLNEAKVSFVEPCGVAYMDQQKRRQILLVEDEAIIALEEQRTLERNGYQVLLAHSGEKSVELVRNNGAIDLVLMDIDLGSGMDGTEAARQILAIRELPIVFLTSHSEKEYVDRVEEITRHGYVLKNAGEFVLIQSIKTAFQLFDAHQETRRHERQLRLVSENATEMIVTVDREGRVTYVTPSVRNLLGYEPEEYLNTRMEDHLEGRSLEQWRNARAHCSPDHVTPITLELEHGKRGGGTLWLETTISPFLDESGTQLGCISSARDIGLRKSLEEDRRRREEEYRELYNKAPLAYLVLDRDGTIHGCNQRAEEILGYARVDLLGRSVYSMFPEGRAGSERLRDIFQRFEAGSRVQDEALEIRRSDGATIQVSLSAGPVRNDRGEIVAVRAMMVDTTDRAQAGDIHAEQEQKYRILIENTEEAITAFDPDGRVIVMNRKAAANFGGEPQDYIGSTLEELLDGEYAREAVTAVHRVVRTGEAINRDWEVRINGHLRWFHTRIQPVRDSSGAITSVLNLSAEITEKRQAEQALRESESRKQLLEENSDDIIIWLDREFRPVFVSQSAEAVLGKGIVEQARGRIFDFVHPKDRDRLIETVYRRIEDRDPMGEVIVRVANSRGEYRWIESRAKYGYEEDGSLKGVVLQIRDVTEREQFRRELLLKDQALNNSLSGIVIGNAEAEIVYVNLAARRMWGFTAQDEIVGNPGSIYVREAEKLDKLLDDVRDGQDRQGEFTAIRQDGTEFPAHFSVSSVADSEGASHFVASIMDMTDQKAFEGQLREGLEEKSRLLAELNHRVKNNLAMVSSLINLKNDSLGEAIDLSDIRNHVDAVRTVHEMLYGADRVTEVDFSSYVDNLLSSLFSGTSLRVSVENRVEARQLPAKTATVLGIIINELATNAIKHGFTSEEAASFTVEFESQGENCLRVTNTGRPFPEEIDIGRTNTLGLRLISALVKQLNGQVTLHKQPHPCFEISFPTAG